MENFHKFIDEVTSGQENAFYAYTAIIVNRQRNPLSEGQYGERHHIIPRSCGGPLKAKWNLVRLTPEEHYVCHYLLTFIYATGEEHESMVYAWNCLSNRIKGKIISAEEYGSLRREYAKIHSRRMTGNPQLIEARKGTHLSDDAKRKVSESNKGKKVSNETRNKISKALTGRNFSEEHKRKISESKTGKHVQGHPSWNKGKTGVFSDETRRKMSKARKHYWDTKKGIVNEIGKDKLCQ